MKANAPSRSDLIQKLIYSPVCFSINDYKNCSELRANNSDYRNAVYHLGQCITDPSLLQGIVDNATHFYGCTVEAQEGQENAADAEKKPGVYVNEKECVALDEGAVGRIDKPFDIPFKLRKTGRMTTDVLGRDSPIFFPPLKGVLSLASRIATHQKIILLTSGVLGPHR